MIRLLLLAGALHAVTSSHLTLDALFSAGERAARPLVAQFTELAADHGLDLRDLELRRIEDVTALAGRVIDQTFTARPAAAAAAEITRHYEDYQPQSRRSPDRRDRGEKPALVNSFYLGDGDGFSVRPSEFYTDLRR